MSARQRSVSLRRAIAASIVLHAAAAALLVVGPHARATSAGNAIGVASESERVSIITRSIRPHAVVPVSIASAPRSRERATFLPTPPVKSSTRAAVTRTLPATAKAQRPFVRVVADTRVEPPAAVVAHIDTPKTEATRSPEVGGAATASQAPEREKIAIPLVVASSVPSAVTQTVALAPSRTTVETSNGGWGETAKPLVEDDDQLAKLRAATHVSGRVSIEIDERGNATHVTLPASLASDVRAELEKQFLALHYLPAECNGLRCTGTLALTL